jgi:heme exporter protein B
MTSRVRSQDVLLPLLLYPLEVPMLLAAVKAFGLVLTGDPMGQVDDWTLFLVAFDVIYWILCGVLSPYILEESS